MYRITENAQYGSREIYFDAKPSNESNAMVDYFNTNFYWDIDTKACEA